MALAIAVTNISFNSRDFIVRGTITPSGSYTTGGDALDFTKATYYLGVDGIKCSSAPNDLKVFSEQVAGSGSASQYLYRANLGTTQANNSMQVFNSAAAGSPPSELSAGAYPAGVTGDVIRFEAWFPKV